MGRIKEIKKLKQVEEMVWYCYDCNLQGYSENSSQRHSNSRNHRKRIGRKIIEMRLVNPEMFSRFRIITDKKECDTNWIMEVEREGSCCFCSLDDQALYVISGDPGHIGICKRCMFRRNKKTIAYKNGKPVDFKKELLKRERVERLKLN